MSLLCLALLSLIFTKLFLHLTFGASLVGAALLTVVLAVLWRLRFVFLSILGLDNRHRRQPVSVGADDEPLC